ncbi:MAG: metallopeptidase TldD-related protein [Candidatus Dojkabacteria bacterium]|nr:metallopeptidase TldD-related protein [Candidatus Dojkabacteria bacterium]
MKALLKTLQSDKEITNYRITVGKGNSLSLGIYGKKIGGAYTPISNHSKVSGELHIEWQDGEISRLGITGKSLERPLDTINSAKAVKIKDEFSHDFVERYTIQNPINQYSDSLLEMIKDNQTFLVDQLAGLQDIESGFGLKSFEIDILASTSETVVSNSKGLELRESFSSFTIQSSLESRSFFTISSREPINIIEYSDCIELLGRMFQAQEKKADLSNPKNIKIMLSPDAAWSLLSFFITNNLRGSLVSNNLAKFKEIDFKKRKRILPEWFNFYSDPAKEMTPGASNFTSEGVRSIPTCFIKQGQLQTPILDLKHSRKLKSKPTALISGPHTTSFLDKKHKVTELKKYIEETEEAIFVPYFLGMHTQNQTTGDYSLPAPYAIYVKDGKLQGTMKVIITGNLFEDLFERVEFVSWDLFPQPGICFTPNVIIE